MILIGMRAFARLATMDKQAEWEDFVAKYQKAAPGKLLVGEMAVNGMYV